ncbi:response regulator [Aurantivibrio infirmus]
MFTTPELKVVIETLAKRRAWLIKAIDSPNTNFSEIDQHKEASRLIETALEKIQEAYVAPKTEEDNKQEEALPDLSHLKILIADDDPASSFLLKELLLDLKVSKVEIAENGSDALKQIFQADVIFDIVLCDWNMPEKSGLEVHSTMRTDSRFKDVIFILVSGNSSAAQIREAKQQGVNDYLVKPVDGITLNKKIIKAYNNKSKN